MDLMFDNNFTGFLKVSKEIDIIEPVMRFKKIPCPYVNIGGDKVKELSSWILIQGDLEKVEHTLVRITEMKNSTNTSSPTPSDSSDSESIEQQSLFISAIVTYGKCFTEARGRVARLDHKEVLSNQHSDGSAIENSSKEATNLVETYGGQNGQERQVER